MTYLWSSVLLMFVFLEPVVGNRDICLRTTGNTTTIVSSRDCPHNCCVSSRCGSSSQCETALAVGIIILIISLCCVCMCCIGLVYFARRRGMFGGKKKNKMEVQEHELAPQPNPANAIPAQGYPVQGYGYPPQQGAYPPQQGGYVYGVPLQPSPAQPQPQ